MFAVAALPDGRIVSGSQDKTLRIWDLNTGACDVVLKGHKNVRYLHTLIHDIMCSIRVCCIVGVLCGRAI